LAPLQSPIALDSVLIQRTRNLLNQVPLSQRIYERLKQRQRRRRHAPGIGLTIAAGPDAPRVFDRKSGQPLNSGVPGLYTYKGYYQFFLDASPKLVGSTGGRKLDLWAQALQISTNPTDRQRIADEVSAACISVIT
jgi:type VI secretion system protein ImpL